MSFAWTPAALDALHRLYVRDGLSAAQTARALGGGATRNAVLGKALRMGWMRAKSGEPPPDPASPALRDAEAKPRVWTERGRRECAFPVGEPARAELQLSCCAPVRGRGDYCEAHRKAMVLEGTALTEKDALAIIEIARRAA